MSSREQFEEWMTSLPGFELADVERRDDGKYSYSETEWCWKSWQASREALEIALPVLEQQEKKKNVSLREGLARLSDHIDQIGGYNFEALRAEQDDSEWIKCSQRTPEPLDWVIAYDEVGTVKAYICQHTGEWIRDNGDELYQVTHRQPLPAPPEDV